MLYLFSRLAGADDLRFAPLSAAPNTSQRFGAASLTCFTRLIWASCHRAAPLPASSGAFRSASRLSMPSVSCWRRFDSISLICYYSLLAGDCCWLLLRLSVSRAAADEWRYYLAPLRRRRAALASRAARGFTAARSCRLRALSRGMTTGLLAVGCRRDTI